MRNFLLACLLIPLAAAAAHAQLPPDKAAKTFQVTRGLDYKLWASEPLCLNPTSMDIDHRGRVWINESINYRLKLRGQKVMKQPEGDRIMILEDTTGQGVANKATVFYQSPEIHAPLGIAVLPYSDGKGVKVFVCQSPDILVFEDRDDDGKADGPPTKLLTGFRGLDHDHGVHGVLIGPDNKLYFTVGDSGVGDLQSSDKKGRKFTSNGTDIRAATVWRCNQDGTNLELIAHNFRNNYEPCVDSFGNVFLSDNDDDGNQQTRICFVMPGGNYGYHRNPKTSHWNEEHPGIVPKILRTYFGSPTGICVYEGALLKDFSGNLLHTEAGPRHVRCYHLTPKGAAYDVKQENIVESTDSWFRPSDVCVAPDGSVYVADWYDPGVGGHGIGDYTRGRIYRLAPPGNKPSVPRVDLTSDDGIVAALGSPNLAVRAVAMAKLTEMDKKSHTVLEKALRQKDDPILRTRALWQVGRLKLFGCNNILATAGMDEDPRFRVLALRVEKDFLDTTPDRLIAHVNTGWRESVVKDPSVAVRREALLLLQFAPPEKAAAMIWDLAKQYDGKDRFYLAAVGIAAGEGKRREVILADFDKHFTKVDQKVAGLLWELRPPQLVAMIERGLLDKKTTDTERRLMIDVLAASDDPAAGMLVAKALSTAPSAEVQDRIFAALKSHLPGKWSGLKKEVALKLLVHQAIDQEATRAAGLELVAILGYDDALPKLKGLAQAKGEKLDVRIGAVKALGGVKHADAARTLGDLVGDPKQPLPLRLAAVGSLGRDWNWISAANLPAAVADSKVNLEVRQSMAGVMAGHKGGADYLLDMYRDKKLSDDLTADLSRLLRNSPFPEVKKRAGSLLPTPPKLDPQKLPSIPALAARKGNPIRGQEIVAASLKSKVACLTCHRINGSGGEVGPDLTVIGAKASRENLLESILHPHRAINHQYQTWIVETKGGVVITGIAAEETPTHLVLRDALAKEHKIDVKQILSKDKSEKSIMPDDLMLYLSEDELLDLVEYLYGLRTSPLAPAGWRREERSGLAG